MIKFFITSSDGQSILILSDPISDFIRLFFSHFQATPGLVCEKDNTLKGKKLPICQSIYPYIYQSIDQSIYPSVYLSIRLWPLYIFLSICLSMYLSMSTYHLSIYLFIDRSIYLTIDVPIYPSIAIMYLPPDLSFYLSLYVYLSIDRSIHLPLFINPTTL